LVVIRLFGERDFGGQRTVHDHAATVNKLLGSLLLVDDLLSRMPGPLHSEVSSPGWPNEDTPTPLTNHKKLSQISQ